MKRKIMNGSFLEALDKKIPVRSRLTTQLMEILGLEREAIYRRLRAEVPFTFAEVVLICRSLNISLDALIGPVVSSDSFGHMKLIEFAGSEYTSLGAFEDVIDIFRAATNDGYSELYSCCNVHPKYMFFHFPMLTRYYLFKWRHLFAGVEKVKTFEQIEITDDMQKMMDTFVEQSLSLDYTCFLFDHDLFRYIYNDIRYFVSMKLIEPATMKKFKAELHRVMDEFEEMAINGHFRNHKKVDVYLTHVNLNTTYSYIESENVKVGFVQAMTINNVVCDDRNAFDRMKRWVHSLIRMSVRVSETGERERIQFTQKIRRMIDEL